MKISKYTFFFSDNDNYYIYNTLSNSLLRIDEESYDILSHYKKAKSEIQKDKIDSELFEILKNKYFITENDKDEFLLYKSIIEGQRAQNETMHLTIAPTMDCNFNCHYCFEKKEKSYISSEVIDSLTKYISLNKELKNIHITWFGGEPLMAMEQIKEFYSKFKLVWDKKCMSNIITTAYHITPQVIEDLKSVDISSIQITLDGNKNSHNKIKYTDDCNDVFSQIISNIDLITKTASEIDVSIRVNLTKENMDDYESLYSFLTKRYKGKNLVVSPAFVKDRGCNDCLTDADNYFFNRKECSEYILKLFKEKDIYTPFLRYPSRFFEECAIRNKTAIGVDPDGYVYKCWEIIGNKKYAIGRLIDGEIRDVNLTVLNRQLYGADTLDDPKCSGCSYLPICNGGCPIHRIENEFEGGNMDVCTYYKGFLPEFMKIHLGLKKRYNNS
ncbi:SPASM domain-containing protein [Dysgonomonas sp. 216]|uniref:radical SAM/SPASM domain-containing protein n=1 Tax=Dysgonomonas sp. 216 TaxID=2302934 RepID=UPI0013D3B24F|nr:SPASM domain-containing protein [Dysgonomonas sp. 216]NDW18129.1 SPASM domain-containing protein [Dysgonomonas sp. 216]